MNYRRSRNSGGWSVENFSCCIMQRHRNKNFLQTFCLLPIFGLYSTAILLTRYHASHEKNDVCSWVVIGGCSFWDAVDLWLHHIIPRANKKTFFYFCKVHVLQEVKILVPIFGMYGSNWSQWFIFHLATTAAQDGIPEVPKLQFIFVNLSIFFCVKKPKMKLLAVEFDGFYLKQTDLTIILST